MAEILQEEAPLDQEEVNLLCKEFALKVRDIAEKSQEFRNYIIDLYFNPQKYNDTAYTTITTTLGDYEVHYRPKGYNDAHIYIVRYSTEPRPEYLSPLPMEAVKIDTFGTFYTLPYISYTGEDGKPIPNTISTIEKTREILKALEDGKDKSDPLYRPLPISTAASFLGISTQLLESLIKSENLPTSTINLYEERRVRLPLSMLEHFGSLDRHPAIRSWYDDKFPSGNQLD